MKDIIKLIIWLLFIYVLFITFSPNIAEKVDEITWTEISSEVSNTIRWFFSWIKESTDNFIDNPAPNSSKGIEERNNL